MSQKLKVVHAAREYAEIAEAGGVKDVVHALSETSVKHEIQTTVILPYYGSIALNANLHPIATIAFSVAILQNEEAVQAYVVKVNGVDLVLLASKRFSEKNSIYTYTKEDEKKNPAFKAGHGFLDTHEVNILYQKALLEYLFLSKTVPDLLHCHDAHAAYIPALARESSRYQKAFSHCRMLLTIHNAGVGYHQEMDVPFAEDLSALPHEVLLKARVHGKADPFLLASAYAKMSTVSARYADELLDPSFDSFTGGLSSAFKKNKVQVTGITNGIDLDSLDPRSMQKSLLPYEFNPMSVDVSGKKACKQSLIEALLSKSIQGIDFYAEDYFSVGRPLFAFHGRLTEQKGIDILLQALASFSRTHPECQFVILGQGSTVFEEKLKQLCKKHVNIAFLKGYDKELARLLIAASDFFLVPSLFEPCGLTDLTAQAYGSLPIVHAVGGLVKIRDEETGFSFEEYSAHALEKTLHRALKLYQTDPEGLKNIRIRAFSELEKYRTWNIVFQAAYLPLYKKLLQ